MSSGKQPAKRGWIFDIARITACLCAATGTFGAVRGAFLVIAGGRGRSGGESRAVVAGVGGSAHSAETPAAVPSKLAFGNARGAFIAGVGARTVAVISVLLAVVMPAR